MHPSGRRCAVKSHELLQLNTTSILQIRARFFLLSGAVFLNGTNSSCCCAETQPGEESCPDGRRKPPSQGGKRSHLQCCDTATEQQKGWRGALGCFCSALSCFLSPNSPNVPIPTEEPQEGSGAGAGPAGPPSSRHPQKPEVVSTPAPG